ncbi:MAG: hypothetical protein JXX29_13985 [Deltaproteobacteria bacterium]|nr:hypothetical protein [Deltaproteobacteria bacterium]MBN2672787.1 hypothetical protein [Deltaproteobacteria bacterium]
MSSQENSRQYQVKKRAGWFWVAFLVSAVIIVAVCAFFGRVVEVTCDKKADRCTVSSKGYLYPISAEELPVSQIDRFETNVSVSKGAGTVRQKRRAITLATLKIRQKSTPGAGAWPISVDVYDWFNYVDPVIDAADKLQTFLQSPEATTIHVTFGTHRTAYAMTLIFLLFGVALIHAKANWKLELTATSDSTLRRLVDKSSDSSDPIHRVRIDALLYGGKSKVWERHFYLFSGSRMTIDNNIAVTHPWGEVESSETFPFPKLLPKAVVQEMKQILTREQQDIPA